jgi:hypothetical protein
MDKRRRTCAKETDEVSISSSESSHPGGFWGVWENENELERDDRLGSGLRLLPDEEGWFGGVNILYIRYIKYRYRWNRLQTVHGPFQHATEFGSIVT